MNTEQRNPRKNLMASFTSEERERGMTVLNSNNANSARRIQTINAFDSELRDLYAEYKVPYIPKDEATLRHFHFNSKGEKVSLVRVALRYKEFLDDTRETLRTRSLAGN